MEKSVVRADHPIVQKKIERGLDLNIREGGVNSVASNFSLSYFSPAALALGASSFQMGILYAVINLIPSLFQIKAANLITRFSRKRLVLFGIAGKALLILPLILIGYLHWAGVPHMVWALIFFVGLHYICVSVIHPSWFSWMGSLVPEEERGKYFSRRTRIVGGVGVGAMIVAALILDKAKSLGAGGDVLGFTLLGFGLLFVLSGLFRVWSWSLIKRVYEPRIKIRKKDRFSLRDFLKHCRDNSFGKFSLFVGAFSFAVGISSPFWAVYMLRDLGMSYIWYVAIFVSPVVSQMMFLPLLGKFSDRFGTIFLMRTCVYFLAVVPLLWVASVFISNTLVLNFYLLIVPQVVAGFGWAGYNLALNNYVYDAVDSRKRGYGLSYMNFLVGVGAFFGALVGAGVALLTCSFVNILLIIFAISGVGRFVVGFFGSRYLHEVRNVKRFSSKFWVREFEPARGFIHSAHRVENLVGKVEHFVRPGDAKKFGEGKPC